MLNNVLDYLERAGEVHPQKILFSDPEEEITYQAFIEKAKIIGTRLAQMGRRRAPVAVLIDRDVKSLECFFGTVYSGNFYVPIGKALPPARIHKILESLKPMCFLAKREDSEFLKGLELEEEVLCLEDLEQGTWDPQLLGDIRRGHIDTDPLYAIFTSGSTGTPKGVVVCHRSVIDLVEQFSSCFGYTQEEVFGNQAPFDFDVSVKDIYGTLCCGGSMAIIPPKLISFPKLLIPYMNEKKVTVTIWAVSALALVATMKGLEKGAPRYLKKIMFSGEVMPIRVLNYWRERLPQAMYVNLYGPTEITCNCTYYILDREFAPGEILPVGRAFPNTEILLLKEDDTLAGEGETGEICVRGTSLALGYYNNPEMTGRAFCQNPLNTSYPELIYRTGDLGTYREGQLYFIGRRDFQIKHMGHRIELGEIEGAMDSLSYVERSCCIYDSEKEKIYLFYQAKENCDREIARDIQRLLPKYMCPNRYVFLEHMPLNKNGKMDRGYLRSEYIRTGGVSR
ncbi:MAG: amino acid adenylation domain-containing protein [Eubacteriales bacterium]|nr:amino acid adenylation domain-containing protein [Eubacteriales bacterium]